MKNSKISGTRRLLAMMALLFSAMIPTSAYAQQEIDPTWFNPWVAPSAAVQTAQEVPVAQNKAVAPKEQKKVKLVSSPQRVAKKHATAQSKPS